jgi:tryptophan synthase alpha chain
MTQKITPPFENKRITECFAKLKQQQKTGLVTFSMAYDPDRDTSQKLLATIAKNGADIVELGMPFSDPMADGPAIQEAGLRALQSGSTLDGVLSIVAEFRETNQHTPVILMGYYNPLYCYGLERFAVDSARAGVDGLIIVDLPPEEDDALFECAALYKLSLIKLVTPTTDSARLSIILKKATGFLYYVSVAGITGMKSATTDSVEQAVALFKQQTDLPIAVGFGIKTAQQAQALHGIADAVVVGSALVNTIKQAASPHIAIEEATKFVKGFV